MNSKEKARIQRMLECYRRKKASADESKDMASFYFFSGCVETLTRVLAIAGEEVA